MVGAQVAAYFPEADAAAYFELDAAAALVGLIEVLAAPARLPCDSKGPLERAPFDQYSAAQPVSAFSCAHGSVSPITQSIQQSTPGQAVAASQAVRRLLLGTLPLSWGCVPLLF
jgi:hypothetical protein